jgi:hypothetical protein
MAAAPGLRSFIRANCYAELTSVTLEAARAMPEPHERSFSDCAGTAAIFSDQCSDNLAIPSLRVLHVEYGMKRKILPPLGRNAEPPQAAIHKAGTGGRRHLDRAQCTDRVKGVAAMPRQRDHGIA